MEINIEEKRGGGRYTDRPPARFSACCGIRVGSLVGGFSSGGYTLVERRKRKISMRGNNNEDVVLCCASAKRASKDEQAESVCKARDC